ncbi:nuclear transport factor 2 family protein [Marinobacter sp. NP-4(2019)]|uniref:nuclear transport factor 2 family protein n=1 Tax=Marinobacter sp. NP-4(2019) TaxID=2488665 RepID=UPI000FC3CDFE|nr:nuclear transport factor 2 family protein [Marinobacter sp. NP-4(2019)]AZT83265.1 nuclear transport factor 2 family protein [Marinobacter sp. NP-4(2019)]
METKTMTDEQRKSIALEYFRRMDRGDSIIELFDDHAQVFFPKWGIATGRAEIETLFGDLLGILAEVNHNVAYTNLVQQGDLVVVEGTTSGKTMSGVKWRAGVTHAGRWCDVFEIRDFKIQRCFIYLDPDYEGADTDRYPWLADGKVRAL